MKYTDISLSIGLLLICSIVCLPASSQADNEALAVLIEEADSNLKAGKLHTAECQYFDAIQTMDTREGLRFCHCIMHLSSISVLADAMAAAEIQTKLAHKANCNCVKPVPKCSKTEKARILATELFPDKVMQAAHAHDGKRTRTSWFSLANCLKALGDEQYSTHQYDDALANLKLALYFCAGEKDQAAKLAETIKKTISEAQLKLVGPAQPAVLH